MKKNIIAMTLLTAACGDGLLKDENDGSSSSKTNRCGAKQLQLNDPVAESGYQEKTGTYPMVAWETAKPQHLIFVYVREDVAGFQALDSHFTSVFSAGPAGAEKISFAVCSGQSLQLAAQSFDAVMNGNAVDKTTGASLCGSLSTMINTSPAPAHFQVIVGTDSGPEILSGIFGSDYKTRYDKHHQLASLTYHNIGASHASWGTAVAPGVAGAGEAATFTTIADASLVTARKLTARTIDVAELALNNGHFDWVKVRRDDTVLTEKTDYTIDGTRVILSETAWVPGSQLVVIVNYTVYSDPPPNDTDDEVYSNQSGCDNMDASGNCMDTGVNGVDEDEGMINQNADNGGCG